MVGGVEDVEPPRTQPEANAAAGLGLHQTVDRDVELDRLSRLMEAAPSTHRDAQVLGPAGQSPPTVNLSVLRRHPCGASAFGCARQIVMIPRCEQSFGTRSRVTVDLDVQLVERRMPRLAHGLIDQP